MKSPSRMTGLRWARSPELTSVVQLVKSLFHQVPGPLSDVVLSSEHPGPAESQEKGFGAEVVGPEFGDMGFGLDSPAFKGLQQPVGMTLVPLIGGDGQLE